MDATKTPDRINNQLGTQLEALSSQIEAGIEGGKYTLADIKSIIREKSTQAAHATQQYVQENPWKLILIGGLLGLGVGVLTRRCLDE